MNAPRKRPGSIHLALFLGPFENFSNGRGEEASNHHRCRGEGPIYSMYTHLTSQDLPPCLHQCSSASGQGRTGNEAGFVLCTLGSLKVYSVNHLTE